MGLIDRLALANLVAFLLIYIGLLLSLFQKSSKLNKVCVTIFALNFVSLVFDNDEE